MHLPFLRDTPKQFVKPHSRPARCEASANRRRAARHGLAPHSALYGVLFAAPQVGLHPKGKLQDRQLRRVQEQDLREDRAFHDLVLVGERWDAPPDIFVVHGSSYLLCHAPGCSTSAGALCRWGGEATATSDETQVLIQVDQNACV